MRQIGMSTDGIHLLVEMSKEEFENATKPKIDVEELLARMGRIDELLSDALSVSDEIGSLLMTDETRTPKPPAPAKKSPHKKKTPRPVDAPPPPPKKHNGDVPETREMLVEIFNDTNNLAASPADLYRECEKRWPSLTIVPKRVTNVLTNYPNIFERVARGVYRLREFSGTPASAELPEREPGPRSKNSPSGDGKFPTCREMLVEIFTSNGNVGMDADELFAESQERWPGSNIARTTIACLLSQNKQFKHISKGVYQMKPPDESESPPELTRVSDMANIKGIIVKAMTGATKPMSVPEIRQRITAIGYMLDVESPERAVILALGTDERFERVMNGVYKLAVI